MLSPHPYGSKVPAMISAIFFWAVSPPELSFPALFDSVYTVSDLIYVTSQRSRYETVAVNAGGRISQRIVSGWGLGYLS